MENQCFYSNGKLLITGEYLVLDGVKVLALPTKFGQDLLITPVVSDEILWRSIDVDGVIWMEERFSISRILNFKKEALDSEYLITLLNILTAAYRLNPVFFSIKQGYNIETRLTFPRVWGLGTSSTLINNIAQWVGVDAFLLLQNSFGGSGYDIACAQYNKPLLYTRKTIAPIVETIGFKPVFSPFLYFVYLNQKQSSKDGIARYRQYTGDLESKRKDIERITQELLIVNAIEEFDVLIEQHETIIASIINLPKVKDALFPDFKGSVKSLGAWGGDFVMVSSEKNPQAYFKAKGFEIVIPYDKMIL